MLISSAFIWIATVLAQVQPGPVGEEKHLSKPKFLIPVSLQPDKVAELQGVLLYVSTTRGKSWDLHGRIRPGEEGFHYLAKSDGVYWFTVAVLDKKGNQEPRDIYQSDDRLKIVVDTIRPEIKLTAERQGSAIQVQWTVREENPDLATMKLEAKIPGGDAWLPVQIKPSLTGSGTLQVPQMGPVEMRMSISDRAGNLGTGEAQLGFGGQNGLSAVGNSPANSTALVSRPAGEPASVGGPLVPVGGPNLSNLPPPSIPALPPVSPPPVPGGAALVEIPAPAPVPSPSPSIPLPSLASPSAAPNAGPASISGIVGGGLPQPAAPVAHDPPTVSSSPMVGGLGMVAPEQSVLASSNPYPPSGSPTFGGGSRLGSAKNIQVVNRRQVRLEYEVTKSGSSGIGSAEVYVTLDEGLNWALAATEPVTLSPADAAGVGPQRMGVMLPLTQEGIVHGFTLVVKSKAGLGRPAPQRGEPPQIRVELDATPPDASLLNVAADPNRKEALIINYKATDRNLSNMPVQLEWAERRDGPWHAVSEGEMSNSGRFLWTVPQLVPPSVYMRLTVKDKAGNVAIAQTPDPLLVDLHVPEFNVLGIQPR